MTFKLAVSKVWEATFKIITSTKGQSLIASELMGIGMAYLLKATFSEWALFAGAMFTMWGVGHQNDKKLESKNSILGNTNGGL